MVVLWQYLFYFVSAYDFHFKFSVYKSKTIFLNFYVTWSALDLELKLHSHRLFSWLLIKICNYNEAKTQSPLTFPKHITLLCHLSRFLKSVKQKAELEGIEIIRMLLPLVHDAAKPRNLYCTLKEKTPLLGGLCSDSQSKIPAWGQILDQSPSVYQRQ